MARHIRTATLLSLLTVGCGLLLTATPAQAQGPYGRNGFEDWPFNQGSLFYKPLKPKPKVRVAPRVVAAAPPQAGYYTTPQPRYYYNPQTGYYYYYPTAPR